MTAMSGAYAQRFLVTLFLVSFGTYLFLATVTYTPFDPGWMHVSSDTQYVSNASGVAGAWIADLLFGFLGWAAIFIPLFLFIEAIQVWWPRSFLNRPFRYVAQFFILIVTSSLLFLCWDVPADTLANASGGIIGYEIGRSLESLLTIYGAVFFLISFLILLCTFAYGIRWDKTWETLRNTPSYLQDLFYRNQQLDLEEKKILEKAQSLTAVPTVKTAVQASTPNESVSHNEQTTSQGLDQDLAEFDKWQQQLAQVNASRPSAPIAAHSSAPIADIDDETFEQTIEKAHQLTQDTQRVVATGEVWRAVELPQHDPRQDIDALLKAADEPQPHVLPKLKISDLHSPDEISEHLVEQQDAHSTAHEQSRIHSQQQAKPALDWDDDIDALLAVVPHAERQQAVDINLGSGVTPTQAPTIRTEQQAKQASELKSVGHAIDADQLDDIFDDLEAEFAVDVPSKKDPASFESTSGTYAQDDLAHSLHALANDVDRHDPSDRSEQAQRAFSSATAASAAGAATSTQTALTKEAFVEAWQDTAGKPIEEDEFDFDAPLTDRMGRPLSRAMQVAERRKDLPPLPGLELLDKVDPNKKVNFTAEQLERLSELLEIKLQEFNVKAKVVEAQPGPVVTRFELDLAPGVKASKVTNISRDLARSMSMASVRVVEVIPGKPFIGIEVPNSSREMVRLIELVQIPKFNDPDAILSMAMGKDISGNPVITELGKAPHMLVAGTTGSGKSVAVNSMILSMLLKYTPDQLRLILIDPKQLELANYNDIPHLLTPVVTDMKDAVSALNWCVNEMERRYKLMSFLKIRKLADYNRKVEEAIANGEDLIDPTWKASDSVAGERPPRLAPLPSIVIVADEFADMIMQVGKKAEEMITRLAQKSRAAGIHLLLATQRPSVDVITGLIKANIPTRVALRVNSKIDSRTILDAGGAEDLLGHGDMLFLGPGKIEPERVHGAFISDDEVNRICDAWRERGSPNYVDEILTPFDEESSAKGFEDGGEGGSDRDPLYDQCVSFVLETRKASTSSLQRKFSLGYNRAARIIDQMEENGIVSSMGANGKRDILV